MDQWTGRNVISAGSPQPAAKSSHVGFLFSINTAFFSRRHFLISVSLDRIFNMLEYLVINQSICLVFARKLATVASFVLQHPRHQKVRHAGINHPILAGDDVHVISFGSHPASLGLE
jgi:hypothetical protein